MEEILLILIGIAWVLGTPIIAIVALVRTGRLSDENARLRADLGELRRRIAEAPVSPPPAPAAELPPAFEPPPVAEPSLPEPSLPEPFVEPVEPPPPPVDKVGWEQRLGARAFIWVGAITLALAAVFLVRYSIEEGYLSPEVRVILAALFGFGLIAGAERLRPRDDRVAQALAAAGVAALYGALFAAVALYGMISQTAAGGGAAALTAFAIGVSLRHGIFVAGLAFVGGFVSPAVVGSAEPDTPVLFGYLLAIAAGTLWVIRLRGWWWLGWGVLAGSAAWVLAWIFADVAGLAWVAAFLVAVAGLFIWATWRNPPLDAQLLVWTSLASTGVLLSALIFVDDGAPAAGWVALAAHGIGVYALARWVPRYQYVAALVPALSLATLALWRDADAFASVALPFGALYAGGAFALMWNAGRPGFWAALSVAAGLGHFLLCWYVLRTAAPGTPWGLISIGLSVPFLVGAERLARWRASMPGATEALGFLAAGVSFFVAAAIPLELSREWITVAYAIELAAVAFIAQRLGLVAMRLMCWPLLATVVVRFVLNPEVLDYPLGTTPVLNWMLWGYGLSIAALLMALRFLRPTGDLRLVRAVEAAIGLLAFVLATLEVRSLFQHDSMTSPAAGFAERTCHVLAWGGFAVAALWLARSRRDPVALWAWRASGALALATALLAQVLFLNPILEEADVGTWPILNLLLLAYAVPAALAGLARHWMDGVEAHRAVLLLAEIAAGVLIFVYLSMEVRHLFDPGFHRPGLGATGLELYAYSIVWLLFGVGLLALGFARDAAALRHAGMALVCVVVAKVFLIDMAGLQGLLRVLSFLGLGAALLGLGYAYRRFGLALRQQK